MLDGIVCASDYIAHFIQRYLEEKGIDPEGRIVLTGFDNNSEYLNVADRITTVDKTNEAAVKKMMPYGG